MPGPLDSSPYEVLQVEATVGEIELKRAYRRRLREAHPDTGGSPALFESVQRAWHLVGTPEARAAYDRGQGSMWMPETRVGSPASPARTRPADTRPRARSYGHPGGLAREQYLNRIREWVGRGVALPDPYDVGLVRQAPRDIRALLAHALAEEATAGQLAGLGIGFTVWHGVRCPDGVIDHVVLGPSGLFALGWAEGDVSVVAGNARRLGRGLKVRFAAAIRVLDDDAPIQDHASTRKSHGLPVLVVERSRLEQVLRDGIPGAAKPAGDDIFEVRSRLTQDLDLV